MLKLGLFILVVNFFQQIENKSINPFGLYFVSEIFEVDHNFYFSNFALFP